MIAAMMAGNIRKYIAYPAAVVIKKKNAASKRPCINCPSPGIKILHKAAITLPALPCLLIKIPSNECCIGGCVIPSYLSINKPVLGSAVFIDLCR